MTVGAADPIRMSELCFRKLTTTLLICVPLKKLTSVWCSWEIPEMVTGRMGLIQLAR